MPRDITREAGNTQFYYARRRKILGAGFLPSNISNLEAWYESDQGITLNGSDVSQWDDLSGNANHLVQATAADQPFYNTTPTPEKLDFDGVSELMATPAFSSSLSQPNTIFCVGNFADNTGTYYLYDGIATNDRNALLSLPDYWIYGGGGSASTVTVSTAEEIHCGLYDGASTTLYVGGGTATFTGSQGTNSLTGLTIGSIFSGFFFLDGSISSLVVYDKLLSTTEINQVGNYLEKFGPTWTDIT